MKRNLSRHHSNTRLMKNSKSHDTEEVFFGEKCLSFSSHVNIMKNYQFYEGKNI